jgi:hypothetical protein
LKLCAEIVAKQRGQVTGNSEVVSADENKKSHEEMLSLMNA